jgi:beta-amylase
LASLLVRSNAAPIASAPETQGSTLRIPKQAPSPLGCFLSARSLRGGQNGNEDDVKEEQQRQYKLTRSYSMSAVVPTAADPDHLEQEIHSGELDLLVRTTREREDKQISVKISSGFLGRKLRESGGSVVLHWGVQIGDDEDWHRPPRTMLPHDTVYRFQRASVHSKLRLNKDNGRAEITLTVPEHKAPEKIRFILFHSDTDDPDHDHGARFWFKNVNQADFEHMVCPVEWAREIAEEAAAGKKRGGILQRVASVFIGGDEEAAKEVTTSIPARVLSENLFEGEKVDEQVKRDEDQVRKEVEHSIHWHWNVSTAKPFKGHQKLTRSLSAEQLMEKQNRMAEIRGKRRDHRKHVKLSVMMPLDLHKWRVDSVERRLQRLKDAGVHGVMCDFWWGLVEVKPKVYDWSFYRKIAEAAKRVGMEIEPVMSFHKCGGNVGDSCLINLPPWVLEEAKRIGRDSVFYTDKWGFVNDEYISLAADTTCKFHGRTPMEMYTDLIASFANEFQDLFHECISKVQIGMGPAGELRYPSFPLVKWSYPGPGTFQCYDKNMRANWARHCRDHLHKKEWEHRLPDTKGYNHDPASHDSWFHSEVHSEYGKAFMRWYADELLGHGDRVLRAASALLGKDAYGLDISGKVAGLHWLYKTPHHATECCAGYYNTNKNDAYHNIAEMFKRYGASFDFTCMEIKTGRDDCPPYFSDPEALVYQAKTAAGKSSIKFCGENALPCTDDWEAMDQILKKAKYLDSFCFLRYSEELTHGESLFRKFAHYLSKVPRPTVH